MALLALWLGLACAGTEPPVATAPTPAEEAPVRDTAGPPPTPVDTPEQAAFRAHAAQSLEVDPAALSITSLSQHDGVSAWRAAVPSESRGPSRKVLTGVVDGEDVLTGSAGFQRWLAAHGREDAVAVATAHHALVNEPTGGVYGSWTRPASKKQPDPAFNAREQLVYYHSEPRRGQLTITTVEFAADGTVTQSSRPAPGKRPGPPRRK